MLTCSKWWKLSSSPSQGTEASSCAINPCWALKFQFNERTWRQEKFKAAPYHITVPAVFCTIGTPPLLQLYLSTHTHAQHMTSNSWQTGLITLKWHFRELNMTWSAAHFPLKVSSAGLLVKGSGQGAPANKIWILKWSICPWYRVALELLRSSRLICFSMIYQHIYIEI